MKKLIFLSLFAFVVVTSVTSKAQVSVNIGLQPDWGPVGYDRVDYYYLPDIETYYYVPKKQYIYLDGGRWVFRSALPGRWGGYNLYNGYKVVINEPRPYLHFDNHKVKYAKYKGNHSQVYLKTKRGNNGNGHVNQKSNGQSKARGKGKGKH